MKYNAVVEGVEPGSIAEEIGIEKGDIICKINDIDICDYLDYKFLSSNEEIVLSVLKKNGELIEFEIYNDYGEDLGIDFHGMLFSGAKSCTNKCIFCFIDQLPPNMRSTMYFKDDDSRLSFLYGNYVTLTNMSDDDIERLIRYRISPVNISVHTVNPDLRVKMLANPNAKNIMDRIMRFYESGILMNMQIVLCKGINDGEELKKSIETLAPLYPTLGSISVVPVGITKYREKLFPLEEFKKEDSKKVIAEVEKMQEDCLRKYGSRIVYLADEFYITAGIPIPEEETYEDFPQIENGVGLIASMKSEFDDALENEYEQTFFGKNIIATGVLAYGYIKELIEKAKKKFPQLDVDVVCIKNDFFGHSVTVSGLLCGGDIIKNLKGRNFDRLLITRSMLKADEDIFLDDVTIEQMEKELNAEVISVSNDGFDFLEKLIN